jgi:hypothetical protein
MPLQHFYAAPTGTYGNALLNWTNHAPSDIASYAVSYRNAAHNLIHIQERRGIGEINHAACPIIFLYRHAIELYLKCLVYRLARMSIDDEEIQNILPRLWKEHSLVKLLEMAMPVLNAMRRQLPPALRDFDPDHLIFLERLDELDSGSYMFRYPVTSKGTASLSSTLLTNIFCVAEEADRALDQLNTLCIHFIEKVEALAPQAKLALNLTRLRQ